MSTTRDRILDEAMRLFAEHGFKATTITKIETAAGLTPGAGGVYHHFPSKDAVLEAGLERQLARLDSLGAMAQVFGPLGDVRAELTLIARYVLGQLDEEEQLLRLLARGGPAGLSEAAQQLAGRSFAGFADWIATRAPDVDATAVAQVTLGALVSHRLLQTVVGIHAPVDDEAFVAAWVDLVAGALK